MKATITVCLAELVENKFGKDKWAAILDDAGLAAHASSYRMATYDIPDEQVGKLIASTCKVLHVTAQQAADAFGEHWCCTYAPRVYVTIFRRFKSARELILGMDKVHVDMTATIANAHPPRFNYVWDNPNTLLVEYKSKRNMIDIYTGLVRGVGLHFKEKLTVTKISPTQVRIVFQ